MTAGVASGQYDGSSTTWYSLAVPASGYYGYSAGLNTVAYYSDTWFYGDMNVQVTLASNPGPNDWVDLESTLVGNTTAGQITPIATSFTFVGNYTYVRIKVSNFSPNPGNTGPGTNDGSIIKVQYAF